MQLTTQDKQLLKSIAKRNTIINAKLLEVLGNEKDAGFVAYLVGMCFHFKDTHFFRTYAQISEDLNGQIGRWAIKARISRLLALNIITKDDKGLPKKRWYTIQLGRIAEIIGDEDYQDMVNLSTAIAEIQEPVNGDISTSELEVNATQTTETNKDYDSGFAEIQTMFAKHINEPSRLEKGKEKYIELLHFENYTHEYIRRSVSVYLARLSESKWCKNIDNYLMDKTTLENNYKEYVVPKPFTKFSLSEKRRLLLINIQNDYKQSGNKKFTLLDIDIQNIFGGDNSIFHWFLTSKNITTVDQFLQLDFNNLETGLFGEYFEIIK